MGAKAWTTTSVDGVPFLKASFPTSSPTVLDVAGENLPWRATMSARLASFPPWGMARQSSFAIDSYCLVSLGRTSSSSVLVS